MAKLGGVLVENLGQSFVDAVAPASPRYRETPSKVKFEHAADDFGGFTVRQDPQTWQNGAYGIVAISTAAYASLKPEDRTQTIKDAKALADARNSAPKSAITVQPATNQSSKKF